MDRFFVTCQCQSGSNRVKMEIVHVFSLTAVIMPHLISFTYACNGYKLQVDYFRNCGKNDVIQLSDDFHPSLNDDCSITMFGCTTVTRSFKSAEVSYDVVKNGAHYVGTKDACEVLENAHGEFSSIMDSVGAQRNCPIKEGTVCGHGKHVSIRKHRIKLPMMAGTTTGKVELATNSGTACFEFSATLSRRLFSG